MPGLRRPLGEDDDEVHEFTRPPRDFEQTEAGGYVFTIGAGDLHPPLTDWLEEEQAVTVNYHTDLAGEAKARFQLAAVEGDLTSDPDWTEQPVRVRLDPV